MLLPAQIQQALVHGGLDPDRPLEGIADQIEVAVQVGVGHVRADERELKFDLELVKIG